MRCSGAEVVPADIGWDDIGAWSALWDAGGKDANPGAGTRALTPGRVFR